MIGFPLFAEQTTNCARARDRSFGLCMNILNFTANELIVNIRDVIDSELYKGNTRRVSDMWREEPITARERATYWVEHVIKYGGDHLRSPSMDMPLYQFLMLDVVGVFLVMLIALLLGLAFGIKLMCWFCCSRAKHGVFHVHSNGAVEKKFQ